MIRYIKNYGFRKFMKIDRLIEKALTTDSALKWHLNKEKASSYPFSALLNHIKQFLLL